MTNHWSEGLLTSCSSNVNREQHKHLVKVLRDLHLDVLELPPDEDHPLSVFVSDCAVVVNGIALLCHPLEGF